MNDRRIRNHTHRAVLVLVLLLGLAGSSTTLGAEAPDALNYQGVLRDDDSNPRNGTFDMVFRFFDAPVGGSEILIGLISDHGSFCTPHGHITYVCAGAAQIPDFSRKC